MRYASDVCMCVGTRNSNGNIKPNAETRTESWRGPGLGGPCLGISIDSSQTRGSVPIADRPSVHCVPVIAGSLKLMELEGSVKERSQTRIALALERYKTAAHGDVERTPKKDGAPVTFRSLT